MNDLDTNSEAGLPIGDEDAPRFDFHLPGPPQLLWKLPTGQTLPQIAGEHIYTWDQQGRLLTLDSTTGKEIERRPILDGTVPEAFWVEEDVMYVSTRKPGEREYQLCAYNLRNDMLLWTRPVLSNWGKPAVYNDLILFRPENHIDNCIYALNASDGTTRWRHKLRPGMYWPPIVVAHERAYVAGEGKAGFDAKGYLLALQAGTGDVKWMYATGGEVQHTPLVTDERIYVGGVEGRRVYALSTNPRSRLGNCLWSCELESLPQQGTIVGDTLYWGSYKGPLYALDAANGNLRWQFHAGGTIAQDCAPCIAESWLFAGCEDGYLYGLDRRTGGLRWKYFAVDDDLLEATAEATSRLESEHSIEEDWDEQERREWEEYLATWEKPTENKAAGGGTQESIWPTFTWVEQGYLYARNTRGMLYCFEVPDFPAKG